MSSKVQIYNLACSALLLSRQFTDVESDPNTNEAKVLNQFWDDALAITLSELDLDGLSEPKALELLAELDEGPWKYVYKYPSNCAFLRRIQSCVRTDTSATAIPKRTGTYDDQKAIFTDEYQAIAECIPTNLPLAVLSPQAKHAVAYQLAFLSAPLLVGKGAKTLREEIRMLYMTALDLAKAHDARENFNYDPAHVRSEWVNERIS